jgi:hypothetical protein
MSHRGNETKKGDQKCNTGGDETKKGDQKCNTGGDETKKVTNNFAPEVTKSLTILSSLSQS